jgi:sirohydrochlorin ferrochelatase
VTTGLLIVGHGSREPTANAELEAIEPTADREVAA